MDSHRSCSFIRVGVVNEKDFHVVFKLDKTILSFVVYRLFDLLPKDDVSSILGHLKSLWWSVGLGDSHCFWVGI